MATAARALGSYGHVSPDARRRVADASAALGYRRNSLARSMITGSTNTLGLVAADLENYFFARAARGFTDAARDAGFDVLVANTDEDVEVEQTAVRVLMEKRVDGMVVSPASARSADHLRAVLGSDVPLVLLDRYVPGLSVDSVLVDGKKAADEAVSHLIAHGHIRIAIVTGANAEEMAAIRRWTSVRNLVSSTRDRILGYRAALSRAGIPLRASYVKVADFHREAARLMALELLAEAEPPTAIFATDSVIAIGVIEALQAREVEQPAAMSLISFDDADWARISRPPLSVVDQPMYELGHQAARRLIGRIRGDTSRPRRHHLPAPLLLRGSIATLG